MSRRNLSGFLIEIAQVVEWEDVVDNLVARIQQVVEMFEQINGRRPSVLLLCEQDLVQLQLEIQRCGAPAPPTLEQLKHSATRFMGMRIAVMDRRRGDVAVRFGREDFDGLDDHAEDALRYALGIRTRSCSDPKIHIIQTP